MDPVEFLKGMKIPIRLSCVTPSGWPIVVSLWYVYNRQSLYCASQKTARIVEYLTANPRCGFEIAADVPPYRGVRGRGIAKLDESRGKEILQALLTKYLETDDSSLGRFLMSRSADELAIEIKPERMYDYDYSNRMKGASIKTGHVK